MSEPRQGRPLLEVDPVRLPPPAASSAGAAPPLALRALVSVGLLAGQFVVAFGLVLGLIGVNLLVITKVGQFFLPLFVLTLLVVLAVGRGLVGMIRTPPEPEDEVEVPAAAEPELHARLHELARMVGTRPPDRVVLTAGVNAYVRELAPLLGLVRGTRILAVGAPLLDVLTVAQLDSVVAHELGHLAGGDTRLGPLAVRTDEAAWQMIASLQQQAVARVFVAYWRFQHRVNATVRRGQELVADRAAVRAAGRQAAADALRRTELTVRAERLYRQAYLGPLLEVGCRPADLASGVREIVRDQHNVAKLCGLAGRAEDDGDPWATHPPVATRIARIAELADPPDLVVDDRPARALWRDADRWATAAHEAWLRLVVSGELRTVTWEQFGEETAVRLQRSRAGDVDRALTRLRVTGGFEGLRQAMAAGQGAALAGELVALGWRSHGPGERDDILAAAIIALALRRGLDGGVVRPRFSWSEPVRFVGPDSTPLPLDDLAQAALTGHWEPLAAVVPSPPRRSIHARRNTQGLLERAASLEPSGGAAPLTGAAVPEPPCPPFQPSSGPWLWKLQLPRQIGTKNRLVIGEDAIGFDKAVLRYDEIDSVSMKIERDPHLHLTVKLRPSSGKVMKLSSAAIRTTKQTTINTAFTYLFHLFRSAVAPRLRPRVMAAIEAGGEAKVGNLTLSKGGITFRVVRRTQVPWNQVDDIVIQRSAVHLVLTNGATVERSLSTDHAFLLVDLIPELRARYG